MTVELGSVVLLHGAGFPGTKTHKSYRATEAPETEARQRMTGSDARREPKRRKVVKAHYTQYTQYRGRPARDQRGLRSHPHNDLEREACCEGRLVPTVLTSRQP